jgi:hypothetical protein
MSSPARGRCMKMHGLLISIQRVSLSIAIILLGLNDRWWWWLATAAKRHELNSAELACINRRAHGRRQHEFQIAHARIRDKLNVNMHAWVANKHVAGYTYVCEGLIGSVWEDGIGRCTRSFSPARGVHDELGACCTAGTTEIESRHAVRLASMLAGRWSGVRSSQRMLHKE